MKLGHANDEIKYVSTEGTVTRFGLFLDGELTMTIVCDAEDSTKIIRITAAHVLGEVLHDTKGRFTTYTKLLEGPDGMPLGTETRVDCKSVYAYVIPRLHVLLGRLLRAA